MARNRRAARAVRWLPVPPPERRASRYAIAGGPPGLGKGPGGGERRLIPWLASGRAGGATVAIPIRLRGQVIGVLSLSSARGPIMAETIALAEEAAGRLALAMENARLLDGMRRSAARERMMAEVATRMRGTLDLDTVVRSALQGLSHAAGGAQVALRLGDKAALLQPVAAELSDAQPTDVGA